MLSESLLSGHTDFEHHLASDLKRAIELRLKNSSIWDRRPWLQTADEGKAQLLERIHFDNQLLRIRESNPVAGVLSNKQRWRTFIAAGVPIRDKPGSKIYLRSVFLERFLVSQRPPWNKTIEKYD